MSQTIQEIVDAMTEEQQAAVYAMVGAALEGAEMEHGDVIDKDVIFANAIRNGSLKDSVIEHAATYGIDQINKLFPEATNLNKTPLLINNNVEWVNKVLNGVSKQPFARVKNLMSDISEDTIRAKGYIKGSLKIEDVLSLITRTTEPTTIYKKQKLDRDDIVDITDFEVVEWVKQIMRMKLNEELARAILIGDGRVASDEYKIDEECIRPIYNDSDLYTVKVAIGTDGNKYKEFINACVRSRKEYKGSGAPALYTTEDLISEVLLLEDATGHRLYKTVDEIKAVLRVSEIIPVEAMVGLVRPTDDEKIHEVLGVITNISDYAVGANKGGQVALFDDFDIDYNQQKYLIETRCSGALTIPYSAMVIEEVKIPEPEPEQP